MKLHFLESRNKKTGQLRNNHPFKTKNMMCSDVNERFKKTIQE